MAARTDMSTADIASPSCVWCVDCFLEPEDIERCISVYDHAAAREAKTRDVSPHTAMLEHLRRALTPTALRNAFSRTTGCTKHTHGKPAMPFGEDLSSEVGKPEHDQRPLNPSSRRLQSVSVKNSSEMPTRSCPAAVSSKPLISTRRRWRWRTGPQ